LRRILKAIAVGMPEHGACLVAGISQPTLIEWKNQYPQIAEAVELAREQLREKLLERVELASQTDWRAADAHLKLAYANDYKRKGDQQHLHLHSGGDQHVTFSIEKQAQIREQRKRILASVKGGHILIGGTAPNEQEEQPGTFRIKPQSLLVEDAQVISEPEQPAIEPEQPVAAENTEPEPTRATTTTARAVMD
jgi:hypothetical protein